MPTDHDEQYRHIKLRALGVCPFGLDCRDPNQAVGVVWRLLSLMRHQVEPLLLTEESSGWSWDSLTYQHLANTLELLGCNDDARDIENIVREERQRPARLRLFAFAAVSEKPLRRLLRNRRRSQPGSRIATCAPSSSARGLSSSI